MPKLLIFILIVMISMACTRVVFDTPQPSNGRVYASIPKAFQGKYNGKFLEVELKKDIVIVNDLIFNLVKTNPVAGEIQLRFANDFFFVNMADSLGYSVFMASVDDEKMAVYILNPDYRTLNRVARYATVEPIKTGKVSLFQVKPKRNGFNEMVYDELFDALDVCRKE